MEAMSLVDVLSALQLNRMQLHQKTIQISCTIGATVFLHRTMTHHFFRDYMNFQFWWMIWMGLTVCRLLFWIWRIMHRIVVQRERLIQNICIQNTKARLIFAVDIFKSFVSNYLYVGNESCPSKCQVQCNI